MRNNGKNTKEIADFCGIPMERVEEMYNAISVDTLKKEDAHKDVQ